jgi:hypothetical protein
MKRSGRNMPLSGSKNCSTLRTSIRSWAAQRAVDALCQRVVLRRVGGVPVVEADMKAVQRGLAAGRDVGHELLRRLARRLGRDHDRRAMRVVGADEVHLVPAQPLEAHPDVGLDVLHDVPDVERSVRIGQRGGDEELAGHGGGF